MRRARFKVSPAWLRHLLEMPPDASIVDAYFNWKEQCVVFIAADPSLPEADHPHDAEPIVTRIHWDWGLK